MKLLRGIFGENGRGKSFHFNTSLLCSGMFGGMSWEAESLGLGFSSHGVRAQQYLEGLVLSHLLFVV